MTKILTAILAGGLMVVAGCGRRKVSVESPMFKTQVSTVPELMKNYGQPDTKKKTTNPEGEVRWLYEYIYPKKTVRLYYRPLLRKTPDHASQDDTTQPLWVIDYWETEAR